jgi:hypothetical protein
VSDYISSPRGASIRHLEGLAPQREPKHQNRAYHQISTHAIIKQAAAQRKVCKWADGQVEGAQSTVNAQL